MMRARRRRSAHAARASGHDARRRNRSAASAARSRQADRDTIDELRGIVINRRHEYPPPSRVNAMIALMARAVSTTETLRTAANASTRTPTRSCAVAPPRSGRCCAGAGAPVAPTERTELICALLADRAPIVRIEAVRAWARQEVRIQRLPAASRRAEGPEHPVVLVAIDMPLAIVQGRRERHGSADRPKRARRRRLTGTGRRTRSCASRAFARGARSSRCSAATFSTRRGRCGCTPARAASLTEEVSALERLAFDRDDNVREATLAPLRRLKGDEAEPYFVAALAAHRLPAASDGGAIELKGAKPTPQLASGLLDALCRVTAEKKETSRDTRLALLERLRELGDPDQVGRAHARCCATSTSTVSRSGRRADSGMDRKAAGNRPAAAAAPASLSATVTRPARVTPEERQTVLRSACGPTSPR